MIDENTIKLAATVASCQAAVQKALREKDEATRLELQRRETFVRTLDEHDAVIHVARGKVAKAAAARQAILHEVDFALLDAVEKGEVAQRAHAEVLRLAKGKLRDEIADRDQHPDDGALNKAQSEKVILELEVVVAQEETESARLASITAAAKKALAAALDAVKKAAVSSK